MIWSSICTDMAESIDFKKKMNNLKITSFLYVFFIILNLSFSPRNGLEIMIRTIY